MRAYFELLRPTHWLKNLAVLVALPWACLQSQAAERTGLMLIAFVVFCLASSCVYAINDVHDRREDLLHPKKKNRPVASGAVSPAQALVFALLLALAATLISATTLPSTFTLIVWGYLVLMIMYSLALKHQPILDVIIIATGFVMRAVAGAVAADVYISPWLIACTFTLCLFLGFGKRRSEICFINNDEEAFQHRKVLTSYSADLLNQLLSTSAGVALITFMLYAMDDEVRPGQPDLINKQPLLYTLPLVAYALFRYAMLIESGNVSGPTDIILNDRILLAVAMIWLMCCALIVLWEPLVRVWGLGL